MQAAITMPLQGLDAVKKMIAENKKQANNDIRGVYFSGLRAIVKQTPVDEGRARNNWFLSTGTPFSLAGREQNTGGNGSYRSISQMPDWVLNKKVFFSNNLPYIGVLEYGGYPSPVKLGSLDVKSKQYVKKSSGGFSKQAPGGWVRTTLIAMANKVRKL